MSSRELNKIKNVQSIYEKFLNQLKSTEGHVLSRILDKTFLLGL